MKDVADVVNRGDTVKVKVRGRLRGDKFGFELLSVRGNRAFRKEQNFDTIYLAGTLNEWEQGVSVDETGRSEHR